MGGAASSRHWMMGFKSRHRDQMKEGEQRLSYHSYKWNWGE
ncbi:unnamed protein product [Rhodiola kirilowii]